MLAEWSVIHVTDVHPSAKTYMNHHLHEKDCWVGKIIVAVLQKKSYRCLSNAYSSYRSIK